jgi:hypothetical protein
MQLCGYKQLPCPSNTLNAVAHSLRLPFDSNPLLLASNEMLLQQQTRLVNPAV